MTQDFDKRLAKADPARKRKPPILSPGLIDQAIATEARLSLRSKFELLSQSLRRLAIGGAVSGSAGVLALVLVISSQPKPLIELSGSQGPRNNEFASAQLEGGADKMYVPYLGFEYLAGPNLSSQAGSGQVYKLVRQSDPETVLNTVAGIFGVEGTIRKYPDFSSGNPGYFFGQSSDPWGYDGENPVISLWWLGTASWNYSNPIAFPQSTCEKTDNGGNCTDWSDFQPTPELLPTREQAIVKALEVFNATGLETSASEIRVDVSEWGVNAYATLYVDGSPTNLEWYVGWSSTGEISYAGGHSVAAEPAGEFETISAVSAVERLSDWRWNGSPSGLFYERFQPSSMGIEPAPYRDNTDPESSSGTSSESPGKSDGAQDTSIMVDPGQPAEPQMLRLTIVKSEYALLSVWDASGQVWLVPGYIMINDQGWFGAVISVIEGVIALPKESDFNISPLPADDSGVSNK